MTPGMGFRGRFDIDPAILEAGDVVAEHWAIPRRDVFRSCRTPDVVAMAARIRAGETIEAPRVAGGTDGE